MALGGNLRRAPLLLRPVEPLEAAVRGRTADGRRRVQRRRVRGANRDARNRDRPTSPFHVRVQDRAVAALPVGRDGGLARPARTLGPVLGRPSRRRLLWPALRDRRSTARAGDVDRGSESGGQPACALHGCQERGNRGSGGLHRRRQTADCGRTHCLRLWVCHGARDGDALRAVRACQSDRLVGMGVVCGDCCRGPLRLLCGRIHVVRALPAAAARRTFCTSRWSCSDCGSGGARPVSPACAR